MRNILPRSTKRFLHALCVLLPVALHAQNTVDFKIGYSRMSITQVRVAGVVMRPTFYRHNVDFELGWRQAFAGLNYQYATKDEKTPDGKTEDGVMLTAGYNYLFSKNFRLDIFGRAAIWGETNPAQPLYATDTDIRFNLVTFTPDGLGAIAGKPIFPSSYFGLIVNKYGRIQQIAGAGFWWNGLGFYATGLMAINGVENPMNAGPDAEVAFAKLKNSGVSLAVSYQYRDVTFETTRNFAIDNAGNDLTLRFQFQHFFRKGK
jgi:hypothetical protein